MLRLMTASLFFLTFIVGPQVILAKSRRVATPKKAIKVQQGVWKKGAHTVVRVGGNLSSEIDKCRSFEVRMDSELRFHIDCQGQSKIETISLTKKDGHTISRKGGQLTITKFNFLYKKPQTSQLEQSSLKIPFVEQIIYIKKQKNGELAFYFESFRLDEFGRIVQDKLIQAHGLSRQQIKVSSLNK